MFWFYNKIEILLNIEFFEQKRREILIFNDENKFGSNSTRITEQ